MPRKGCDIVWRFSGHLVKDQSIVHTLLAGQDSPHPKRLVRIRPAVPLASADAPAPFPGYPAPVEAAIPARPHRPNHRLPSAIYRVSDDSTGIFLSSMPNSPI